MSGRDRKILNKGNDNSKTKRFTLSISATNEALFSLRSSLFPVSCFLFPVS